MFPCISQETKNKIHIIQHYIAKDNGMFFKHIYIYILHRILSPKIQYFFFISSLYIARTQLTHQLNGNNKIHFYIQHIRLRLINRLIDVTNDHILLACEKKPS